MVSTLTTVEMRCDTLWFFHRLGELRRRLLGGLHPGRRITRPSAARDDRKRTSLVLVIEPTFEVAEFGRWAVMRVTGEIDMATAPRLRQHVQTVTARKPAGLVLDLDRVDFIDSTGLGVMVGAAKRMRMIERRLPHRVFTTTSQLSF